MNKAIIDLKQANEELKEVVGEGISIDLELGIKADVELKCVGYTNGKLLFETVSVERIVSEPKEEKKSKK